MSERSGDGRLIKKRGFSRAAAAFIGVFAIGFAVALMGVPVGLFWLPFAVLAGGLAYYGKI
jgi:hypothetical protein